MIIGIGIDLIEIQRVEEACKKQHFFTRCFSFKERELIKENWARAAGSWAVKEAVAKAFGTGIVGFDLNEIEVLREDNGKPYVELKGKAYKLSKDLGIHKIHVSVTNTKEYACAYVVAEGRGSVDETIS